MQDFAYFMQLKHLSGTKYLVLSQKFLFVLLFYILKILNLVSYPGDDMFKWSCRHMNTSATCSVNQSPKCNLTWMVVS